jgi:hypothetical protein
MYERRDWVILFEVSLAWCTCVFGHEIVIALLPRWHVLREAASERVLALLLHGVLIFEALLHLLEASVVLLILAEDFGVLGHVLLIGQPSLIMWISGVLRIADVVINCTNVVVVNTVLNVVKIIMSQGDTILSNLV